MISISLLLFILGVLFIVIGYTKQVTPGCNEGKKIKLVNRSEFAEVSGLNSSHFGTQL